MRKNFGMTLFAALLPFTVGGCMDFVRYSHPWDQYSAYFGVAGLTLFFLWLVVDREHEKTKDHSGVLAVRTVQSIAGSIVLVWGWSVLCYFLLSKETFMWVSWILFLIGLGFMAYKEKEYWVKRKKYLENTQPATEEEPEVDEAKWEKCPQCGVLNPKGFVRCHKCKHPSAAQPAETPPTEPAAEPAQDEPPPDPPPRSSRRNKWH